MAQLRRVSLVVAIIASLIALVAGFVMFFLFEHPILASIFLASALIAIGCFGVAALSVYFSD